MKSSLRPGFDPLPLALSTRSLLALVGIVLLGTCVTVERYLESSKVPAHVAGARSSLSRPSEVRAAAGDARALPYDSSGAAFSSDGATRDHGCRRWVEAPACRRCPRVDSADSTSSVPVPSLFRPGDDSTGS